MPVDVGKGGTTTSEIEVINSGTTNVDADSTVEIQGLDNINQSLTLDLPQPLRTESRQELAVTEPVVTDSRNALSLDIRPITADLCLNVKMGPPAPTCIRQPYEHRFGFTLFGIEMMGLNFSGEAQTIVQDMPKQPQVTWGGPDPTHRHPYESSSDPGRRSGAAGADRAQPRAGLRIRL